MKKPNLFLIGAPKCGTTALAKNLSKYSKIYLPDRKEPRFFDKEIFYDYKEDYITKTLDEYLSYYKNEKAQNSAYRLDASVFIMYNLKAFDEIFKLSPDSKFIVIVRDPVDASISMFNQRLSYTKSYMREVCDDFNKCWDLLELRKKGEGFPKGCRNKFLFRYDLLYSYQDYLPFLEKKLGDRLFIGFYDDYKNDFERFIKKLFKFLDLEYENIENFQYNKSFILKNNKFLELLDMIGEKSINFRRKIGLVGIGKYKKKIISLFSKFPKKFEVKNEVYEFFKPTYRYLDELRKKY